MKSFVLAILALAIAEVAPVPTARADTWNKKTILTVAETIQVPNKVLLPGTYVMKLLSSPSDRHIVQIYNSAETHLETTVLAIPVYRVRPTDKSVFTFWETPPGQPKALRAWFYPGDNFGQEFPYPKFAPVQIAAVSQPQVPLQVAEPTKPAEEPTAPVATAEPAVQEAPVQREVTQNTPPQQAQPAAEPTTPAPAPPTFYLRVGATQPQELPKAASPYPLVGLAGLLSLGLFALVRAVRFS
jgi:hypothetical protein